MHWIQPAKLPFSQLKAGDRVMLEIPDTEKPPEAKATHIVVGTLVGATEDRLFLAGTAFYRSTGLPVATAADGVQKFRLLEATEKNLARLWRQRTDQEEKWHRERLEQLRLVKARIAHLCDDDLCRWLSSNAMLSQLYDLVQQDIHNGVWHADTD